MTTERQSAVENVAYYRNHSEHLADELLKLDLVIRQRVTEFRLRLATTPKVTTSQQMYISHDEVDLLLQEDGFKEPEVPELIDLRNRVELLRQKIIAKIRESFEQRIFLPIPQLARTFSLSSLEIDALVICLAPEIDRRYDRLYAYLQDDITRKKPSIDLVLTLLCETNSGRWKARTLFSEHAQLIRAELLRYADDPQSPSGSSDLARFLKLDGRILNYLLGISTIDERLIGIAKLYAPLPSMDQILVDPIIKAQFVSLVRNHFSDQRIDRRKVALHLRGPYGVGKLEIARGVCREIGSPVLCVDMEAVQEHEMGLDTLLRIAFREGLLQQSALFLDHVDSFIKEEGKTRVFGKKLANLIAEYGWLTFLSGESARFPEELFKEMVFHAVDLPVPDLVLREKAWEKSLGKLMADGGTIWSEQLASQFLLTPGQIDDALNFVTTRQAMNEGQKEITLAELSAACRQQSNHKLGELTVRIKPNCLWEDIILPEDKIAQLREICTQVKHRYRVLSEWGFGRRLTRGKGVSALFSGPPGTGKTMAAEVIASELQLDLYKIDLSRVVSKYIGETEKNLAKIFHEAETSNAILFFDEADALFGKRTEVSDAHDRYANIETSYLLQKMEEHEGVVILATNLRGNMDDAFTRRIRFVVEFPFPDAESRLRIWKTHFPREAPVSENVDYELLSKQFQVAGGNIRNIVLNAAFFAAENGGVIKMEHLLRGTRREFEKIGKLWNEKNLSSSKDVSLKKGSCASVDGN